METPTAPGQSSWLLKIAPLWTTAAALLLTSYLSWTYMSSEISAQQAALHPWAVIKNIALQLSSAESPGDWNIPGKGIATWLQWLVTVLTSGYAAVYYLAAKAPHAEKLCYSFGIGFVITGLVALTAGLFRITGLVMPVILMIGAVATLRIPKKHEAWRGLRSSIRWQYSRLSRLQMIAFILLGLLWVFALVPALTPPVQSDAVRYHLGAIQQYIRLGRIEYLPLNAYSNMPFLVEMNFMCVLQFGTPEAAQLIHATLAAFTALAIYCLARRLAGDSFHPAIGAGLGALYLAIPASTILAGWPFTDHAISFFLLLSTLATWNLISHASARSAILTGLCLGGLLGTKYTMAPAAAILSLVPLLSRGKTRSHLKPVFITIAVAGILGGVWYVKNIAYTGNPFYPLASKIFPGGEWTPEADRFLKVRANAKGLGKSPTDLLLSPWTTTFQWIRFEAQNLGATPLLILLGVLWSVSLYPTTRRKPLLWITTFFAVNYLLWFYSYQSNRLLLPVLALALPLLSPALSPASLNQQRATSAIWVLTCLYGLCWAIQWAFVGTSLTPPPLRYLTGQISRQQYINQSLTYGRAYDYLNRDVKPNERVLLIGEHRIYGAQFPAYWSDWFDVPAFAHLMRKHHLTSTDALLRYLVSNNFRWIYINDAELERQIENDFRPRLTDTEWQTFQDLHRLPASQATTREIGPGGLIIHLIAAAQ